AAQTVVAVDQDDAHLPAQLDGEAGREERLAGAALAARHGDDGGLRGRPRVATADGTEQAADQPAGNFLAWLHHDRVRGRDDRPGPDHLDDRARPRSRPRAEARGRVMPTPRPPAAPRTP